MDLVLASGNGVDSCGANIGGLLDRGRCGLFTPLPPVAERDGVGRAYRLVEDEGCCIEANDGCGLVLGWAKCANGDTGRGADDT